MDEKQIAQGKHFIETSMISYQLYRTYVAPLVLGPIHPYDVNNNKIKNGTIFFVQGEIKFAVTCAHCIDEYLEWKKSGAKHLFENW